MSIRALVKLAGLLLAVSAASGCAHVAEPHDVQGENADIEAEWANLAAQFPGLSRPEVQVIHRVTPETWASTIVACLNDAGYPEAEVAADGSLSFTVSDATAEDFALAKYVCVASYPLERTYTTPLSESQLGKLYDYLVTVQAPCLEKRGFAISDPPSKQDFVDSYASSAGWLPYSQLPEAAYEENSLRALLDTCPEQPEEGSEFDLYS